MSSFVEDDKCFVVNLLNQDKIRAFIFRSNPIFMTNPKKYLPLYDPKNLIRKFNLDPVKFINRNKIIYKLADYYFDFQTLEILFGYYKPRGIKFCSYIKNDDATTFSYIEKMVNLGCSIDYDRMYEIAFKKQSTPMLDFIIKNKLRYEKKSTLYMIVDMILENKAEIYIPTKIFYDKVADNGWMLYCA